MSEARPHIANDPSEPEFGRVDAFGAVVEVGRGHLPFALVHGEALVAAAAFGLRAVGVRLLDAGTSWSALTGTDLPLVLHDALCPLTPPDFIAECLHRTARRAVVTVGVRPVTDTVKEHHEGILGATVDRGGLVQIASPIVLPAAVVDELEELPSTDFAELVAELARRFPAETVEAPPAARRVADEGDLRVLEALTAR